MVSMDKDKARGKKKKGQGKGIQIIPGMKQQKKKNAGGKEGQDLEKDTAGRELERFHLERKSLGDTNEASKISRGFNCSTTQKGTEGNQQETG